MIEPDLVKPGSGIDWTTVLLALITAIVTLGGPIIAYYLKVIHTAVNTNYQAMEVKLAANLAKLDTLNQKVLSLSIDKSQLQEQARPSGPSRQAAPAAEAKANPPKASGEGEPLTLPATVKITEDNA